MATPSPSQKKRIEDLKYRVQEGEEGGKARREPEPAPLKPRKRDYMMAKKVAEGEHNVLEQMDKQLTTRFADLNEILTKGRGPSTALQAIFAVPKRAGKGPEAAVETVARAYQKFNVLDYVYVTPQVAGILSDFVRKIAGV